MDEYEPAVNQMVLLVFIAIALIEGRLTFVPKPLLSLPPPAKVVTVLFGAISLILPLLESQTKRLPCESATKGPCFNKCYSLS